MALHRLAAPALGVVWDDAVAADAASGGGEFLLVGEADARHLADFRPFRLAGGNRARLEPCRAALGVLFAMFGEAGLTDGAYVPVREMALDKQLLLRRALVRAFDAPLVASAARLFDAAASLLGECHHASFEGQGTMQLGLVAQHNVTEFYPFERTSDAPWQLNWAPVMERLLTDRANGLPVGVIAARFHNTMAEIIVSVAREANAASVVLAGDCFNNRFLTERALRRLREEHLPAVRDISDADVVGAGACETVPAIRYLACQPVAS
jgi:hydrogenase maturation protein HypF